MKNTLLLFLCLASLLSHAQAPAPYYEENITIAFDTLADRVVVNLAEPVKANSMVGFLDGLKNKKYPDRDDIRQQLKPRLFRTSHKNIYKEAYDLSGRVHMIVTGDWNHSHNNAYLDMGNTDQTNEFEKYLEQYFKWGYNNGNIRPGIVWECWNEPDVTHLDNFFEVYKTFYKTLRSSALGETALAAGPSLGYFNKEHLKAFFDYCLSQSPPLEVNVITWHEIDGIVVNYKPMGKLQEHVQYVRENFVNNPKYAPLNFKTIEINEIIGGGDKNNPVSIASYLGNLERANIDYAVKSCWPHTVPWIRCEAGSCDDVSLNDLYTVGYDAENKSCDPAEPNKKKSAWWVYKLYTDGVAGRVKSYNEEPAGIVIASKIANPETPQASYAQVLFGYSTMDTYGDFYGNPAFLPKTGNYRFTITGIDQITSEKRCYVKISKIPYNGKEDNKELAAPIIVYNEDIKVNRKKEIDIKFNAEKECLYQLLVSATPFP